jgi:GDP-4-dehydro-6-deoxy-D-mannose reductase
MAVRAFVTGLTGFAGQHLARMLIGRGCEVCGLGCRIEQSGPGHELFGNVSVAISDIRDYVGLREILKESQPDHVYHLAAVSNVVTSFTDPRMTYDVNVGGTLNLFEGLRELDLRPRIVNISTAHVYRSVTTETGLDENVQIHLATPYAASKFMCEALVRQYVEAYGFQAMTVRPFNHVGPGQLDGFVCSDFARQIATIKLGKSEPVLHVGNLDPVRDFTDVRDTVEAYWIVATQGVPGEPYNVSSHHPLSIHQIVSMLCELADVRIAIEVDQQRVRSIETMRLFGNSLKVRALGWEPRIGFEQTLKDTLDYWLAALA